MNRRFYTTVTIACAAVTLAACGTSDDKSYDISPIFPLSTNKCAKYNGTVDGSGITAACWVTKDECEQAVSDWRQAMRDVPDAIEFKC